MGIVAAENAAGVEEGAPELGDGSVFLLQPANLIVGEAVVQIGLFCGGEVGVDGEQVSLLAHEEEEDVSAHSVVRAVSFEHS